MESVFGVESPAYVAIRFTLSAASLGLIGALVLRTVVLPRYEGPDAADLRGTVDAALPRWIAAIGAVAILATVARLAAQHAAVFGTDVAPDAASLQALLLRAAWGRSWWLALASAALVTFVASRRPLGTRAWTLLSLGVLGFAASQPWSGHPAASAWPLIGIGTQLLHVIGAGAWLGTLALLAGLAIPAARRAAHGDASIAGLVRAFSPVALAAATLLLLSGGLTAWDNLDGLASLWESAYGRTLALKLALLALTAAVGAFNWRRVLPALGSAEASATLQRSVRIELAVATLVLIVTAVLVATPMPGE